MKTPETDKSRLFCELFCDGVNGTQAAIKAGYSEHTATQQAYKLKLKYADYIAAETEKNLRGDASLGRAVVRQLATKAKHDSVRLKAATTLLLYSGMKPIEKQEVSIVDRSDKEIDAALEAILGKEGAKMLTEKVLN